MKQTKILAVGLTALLSASMLVGSAFADPPRQWNVNGRQDNQHDRIRQGVRSGDLTRHEARDLRQQERRINRYEARSRADGGGLSPHERERLDRMQSRESHRIYNQKHDRQDRH